jgi:DNA polymerase elongation subunit (family B)
MNTHEFLVLDLETTSIKVEDAIIKVFGAYDPLEDKYYIYKWNDESLVKVMQLFETYKILITFNGIQYDMPLLEKHGVPVKNYKHIDVYNIFKYKRTALLRKNGFRSYSLKSLLETLELDSDGGKGIIDYEIFKKDSWTKIEQEEIIKYLKADLVGTWKLWKYVLDRFQPLAKYLPPKDVEVYKHITASLPTYVYKVLCHITGIRELYDEAPKQSNNPLLITTFPRKEKLLNAALLKFNSLYAHTIFQFNLLSSTCKCCIDNEGKFHGRNYYIVDGFYCQRRQGIIEKFLKELERGAEYDTDLKFIRNIIFSQLYAVLGNALYYSIYNTSVAKDIVALAKHQLSVMSRMFEEKGYMVVNIDIDNVFINIDESKGQSVEELLIIKDDIIKFLQSKMPFKSETFDLKLVHKLQYVQFVKKNSALGDPQNFMKKGEYLYVTETGQVGSKGISDEDMYKMLEGVNV